MLRPYLLWLRGSVVASCLIPLIVLAYNIDRTKAKLPDSSTLGWDRIQSDNHRPGGDRGLRTGLVHSAIVREND